MKFAWLQLIFVSAAVIAGGGFYTSAYFFDIESSDGALQACILDSTLSGPVIEGQLCDAGEQLVSHFAIQNTGKVLMAHDFTVTNVSGALCGQVEATLTQGENIVHVGPLMNVDVVGLTLEADASETLTLEVYVPERTHTSGACYFDTVHRAYQEDIGFGGGFTNEEILSHMVERSDGECTAASTSSVHLYLNKHISGETLGYALSDFSYHVVGDGIDAVVPHGSTIELPIGEYSIEELVPADFVKEDWRIGWYGQCERGSDFVTTITIDEGNIDHGILYCEADNQYRPDHGDNLASSDETLPIANASSTESVADDTEVVEEVLGAPSEVLDEGASTTETVSEETNDREQRSDRETRSTDR